MQARSSDGWIVVSGETRERIRRRMDGCLRVLEVFEWIINSFVLDFFLDSHWSHLPPSWKDALANISPKDLASFLDPASVPVQKSPWPLSLLALKQTIHHFSLQRTEVADLKFVNDFLAKNVVCDAKPVAAGTHTTGAGEMVGPWQFYPEALSEFAGQHAGLKHVFRKHVKPKKQHELARLAKLTRDVFSEVNVGKVIDVGSGMGHLSRYLCYAHNLQVACVDENNDFTAAAKKFDCQLEESVNKMRSRSGDAVASLPPAPVHVTARLEPGMNLDEFHSILSERFSTLDADLRYGLVGLHTCGDLGPILFKMFSADDKALVLQSVGCCYMKLVAEFPLSGYLRQHGTAWRRNYTNSELACHAIEMYTERLRAGEEDKLRVHCYRALLETLLVRRDPSLRHTQLRTVARAHQLDFPTYARQATSKLDISWEEEELSNEKVQKSLAMWWKVVIYYTLRLSLAPMLETVLLLDRCLYLEERNMPAVIFPLFNPLLSPRNQIILAVKRETAALANSTHLISSP